MDVVIITPEPGRQKEIGQKLLALADRTYDVQWVTWPTAGFSIPLELFARFSAEGQDVAPEPEVPATRRRRRNSTDNNTSEEE